MVPGFGALKSAQPEMPGGNANKGLFPGQPADIASGANAPQTIVANAARVNPFAAGLKPVTVVSIDELNTWMTAHFSEGKIGTANDVAPKKRAVPYDDYVSE